LSGESIKIKTNFLGDLTAASLDGTERQRWLSDSDRLNCTFPRKCFKRSFLIKSIQFNEIPYSFKFECFKNNEQIVPEEWIRYRPTGGGSTLKISTAEPSDSGHYLCRAINGFGTVDVTISLVVDTGKWRQAIQ
jgi:Immunoglobulin I-set domain